MAGYGDNYSELTDVFFPALWSPHISSTVAFSHAYKYLPDMAGYGHNYSELTDVFSLSCGHPKSAQRSNSVTRIHVNFQNFCSRVHGFGHVYRTRWQIYSQVCAVNASSSVENLQDWTDEAAIWIQTLFLEPDGRYGQVCAVDASSNIENLQGSMMPNINLDTNPFSSYAFLSDVGLIA